MKKMYVLDSVQTDFVSNLINRYPVLDSVVDDFIDAYFIMKKSYEQNGKLLIAGNGGSAADSEHIAGELMKRFQLPRPVTPEFAEALKMVDMDRGSLLAGKLEQALMAIPMVAQEALSTAYLNDVDGQGVFAQQVLGYGRQGDVFLAISTSGNSENVLNAAVTAKAMGVKVIGLTGLTGGKLADFSDVIVRVPETETYKVQELHLPVYHCWCMMLEYEFFGEKK